MVGLRVATFCPPNWAKSSSDRAPWRKWALRGTMGCGQMVCVTFSIGAHIPACAHLGERDWVSPRNHPPDSIGCPPDQLWQCSGLQPEGLVLGAQSTDGRLRGYQCSDTAVGGKSDAGILPGTGRGAVKAAAHSSICPSPSAHFPSSGKGHEHPVPHPVLPSPICRRQKSGHLLPAPKWRQKLGWSQGLRINPSLPPPNTSSTAPHAHPCHIPGRCCHSS